MRRRQRTREDMPQDQPILVATDFSSNARAGLEWAIELGREHSRPIHLVHALILDRSGDDFAGGGTEFNYHIEEIAKSNLQEMAESIRSQGLAASWSVGPESPVEVILRATEATGAGLIVMGTRGLHGFRRLLLGSTTERVIQRAPAPVLSVHPHDTGRQRPVRTIMVATDFSAEAEAATEAATDLFRIGPGSGKILLLHAFHVPVEFTQFGPYGPTPPAHQVRGDTEEWSRSKLEEVAAELRSREVEVETRFCQGYPPQVILSEAAEQAPDLIAMGTVGRTGLAHLLFGSTAERVLQYASCPVLTVRKTEKT